MKALSYRPDSGALPTGTPASGGTWSSRATTQTWERLSSTARGVATAIWPPLWTTCCYSSTLARIFTTPTRPAVSDRRPHDMYTLVCDAYNCLDAEAPCHCGLTAVNAAADSLVKQPP